MVTTTQMHEIVIEFHQEHILRPGKNGPRCRWGTIKYALKMYIHVGKELHGRGYSVALDQ